MQREFPQTELDLLGHTFRSRLVRRGAGKIFVSFSPAISGNAATAIRQTVPVWALQPRANQSLHELAPASGPSIRRWVDDCGAIRTSALPPALREFDRRLASWAKRKHKRLRGYKRGAAHWVRRVAIWASFRTAVASISCLC